MPQITKVCACSSSKAKVKGCGLEKPLSAFQFRPDSGKYRDTCKECKSSYDRKYRAENLPCIKAKKRNYYEANRHRICSRVREYTANNPAKVAEQAKNRYRSSPRHRLKFTVTNAINKSLKKVGKSKSGVSCLKFLPYSFEDLKLHLESLFEPWMSWSNHGRYSPSVWDDEDPKTWTWQLDHIVPLSYFDVKSIEDPELIRCWALSNLRPLSSKKNIEKGNKVQNRSLIL